MALDPLVVLCPPLQEYFVDKDSGAPLSGGVVTFYEDNDPTVLKPIYQLNGNGHYSDASYIQLNNPLILSSVGTFMDNNGNDIIPYLFPYQGVPGGTNEIIDLYYITVYSAGGILQFTRSGWPNTATSGSSSNNELINYIPNPQFLLHNNNPITTNVTTAVPSDADVTYIAQGGWTFKVPHGTSSVNSINFVTNANYFTNPDITGDPRYLVNIECTVPSNTDTFKDLCIAFPDVNKFASDSVENDYTFSFQGESLSGSSLPVQIRLLKYFGSGGSPSTSTDVPFGTGNLTIDITSKIYNIQGLFVSNAGFTLGTNNDDYLQIAIRLPNLFSNIQLTDFILTNGAITITGFPVTTNSQMLDSSTAGWLPTPNPDGFDLYLPAVLTPTGLTFSNADVGKIYAAMYETLPIGELDCNGTQYLGSGYSSDGIPYARLQSKWFNSTVNTNYFGNGINYASANYTNVSSGSTTFRLNITSPGAGTIIDGGSVPTGFTFATIADGYTSGCVGYISGNVTAIDNVIGAQTPPTAATSGFTIIDVRNTANSYHVFSIGVMAPTSLAGTYFTFSTSSGNFYMWFTVDGAGSDPAPGGTGVKVNLLSTYIINEVARCVQDAISGFQTSLISPLIGSSVVAGSYFSITTPSSSVYYVWYQVNGVGTDPNSMVAAANKILVNVLSTDTIATVVTKTLTAINMKYYAVPDLRGQFLRGWDAGAGVDPDAGNRLTLNNIFETNQLGSYQLDQYFSHLHSLAPNALLSATQTSGGSGAVAVLVSQPTGSPVQDANLVLGTTVLSGGNETRPQNTYVRWVVKY